MSDSPTPRFNPWRFGIVVSTAVTLGGWAVMTAMDRRAEQPTPPEPELVEVCIAASDLPVGTVITPEDVASLVTRARIPKANVVAGAVVDEKALYDKRLSRPLRTGELFNGQNLHRGSAITLPEGMLMVSVPVYVSSEQDESGQIGPGCRVHITVTNRTEKELKPVLIAHDCLVVAVSTDLVYNPAGAWHLVSIAVERDTLVVITLAKTRVCEFSVKLPNPYHPFDSEPVNHARVKQFLESLSAKP